MGLPKPRNLIIGVVIALLVVAGGLLIAQDQETLRVRTELPAADAQFPEYLARLLGAPLTTGDAYIVHTEVEHGAARAAVDPLGGRHPDVAVGGRRLRLVGEPRTGSADVPFALMGDFTDDYEPAAAAAAVTIARPQTPRTGCNGFPFSRMQRVKPVPPPSPQATPRRSPAPFEIEHRP